MRPVVAVRCLACDHEWLREPASTARRVHTGAAASSRTGADPTGHDRGAFGTRAGWVEDTSNSDFSEHRLRRLPRRDAKQRAKVAALQELPAWPRCEQLLAALIACLWAPRRTEADSWTLSCLPGTNADSARRRLFTLNVSNVEVAYAYEDPRTHEDRGGALYVSKARLRNHRTRLRRDFGVDLVDGVHAYLCADETGISFPDLAVGAALTKDEIVSRAMRARTVQLMSEGQVPGMQRQWHNAAFAEMFL